MKRTESLFLALNFSEGNVPDKIQLLPAPDASGRITGNDGRSWTIENPANVALLSNRYLEPQPIDENHSTDLAASHGKSARAFGWYKNIRAEAAAQSGRTWNGITRARGICAKNSTAISRQRSKLTRREASCVSCGQPLPITRTYSLRN